MVSRIKTQLYEMITGLGYRVADVRPNQEPLPWLLIRTGGHTRTDTMDFDNFFRQFSVIYRVKKAPPQKR